MPGNRNKLLPQAVFQSVADRDDEIQIGMEEGVNNSYYHLKKFSQRMKEE